MKKKEVEVVLLDIHKTTSWDTFVLHFLTEDYDEIFIPFIYQGSLIDAEAKYKFHKEVFEYLLESFSKEIAQKLLKIKGEKKKKAAWMDLGSFYFI